MKGERGRKFPTEQTEIRGERKTLWPGKMMRLLPRKKRGGGKKETKKAKGNLLSLLGRTRNGEKGKLKGQEKELLGTHNL